MQDRGRSKLGLAFLQPWLSLIVKAISRGIQIDIIGVQLIHPSLWNILSSPQSEVGMGPQLALLVFAKPHLYMRIHFLFPCRLPVPSCTPHSALHIGRASSIFWLIKFLFISRFKRRVLIQYLEKVLEKIDSHHHLNNINHINSKSSC